MNTEEALRIADRIADSTVPWSEHPSMISTLTMMSTMVTAYRTARQKVQDLNVELDRAQGRWSDLTEFIRTALGLSDHALDDVADVRRILGCALADARLWARVKGMATGDVVAGDTMDAGEALSAFGKAVKSGARSETVRETVTVRMDAGETVKVGTNGVYVAPEGTNPKDTAKWTLLATRADWVVVESRKTTAPKPAIQRFDAHAPEPSARVQHVRRLPVSAGQGYVRSAFTRVGKTVTGLSIWHEDGQPDPTVLWGWPDVVRYGAEEIRP